MWLEIVYKIHDAAPIQAKELCFLDLSGLAELFW
jgi:hypothetical protein